MARYPSRWLSAAALVAAAGLTSAAAAQSPPPSGAPQTAPAPALLPLPRLFVEPLLLEQEQTTEHGVLPRAALPPLPAPVPHATRCPGQAECHALPEEVMLRCLLFSIHPIAAFLPIEFGTTDLPTPNYREHQPQYFPPTPDRSLVTTVPVAELLAAPQEAERLDVMPAEVEEIKVMPAAEESELKYQLLGPWTDSAQVLSLPLLPLAEIRVGVKEAKTGSFAFGVGAELSRTGTIVVSAESLAEPQPVPPCPAPTEPADKKAGATETQVMVEVLVSEVDRKGARALSLDRAEGTKPRWVIEDADEARQAAFVGALKGLREKGLAKLVAEPRLVMLNGRQGCFVSGSGLPVPVLAATDWAAIEFMRFGTQLTCRPTVLPDGNIHLEVEHEISEVCETAGVTVQGKAVPGRSSQRLHATADLAPGHALLISGPKAGDNARLVVLVTPSVVQPPAAPDAVRNNAERRTMIRINQSENLRQIEAEMEKSWMNDKPTHLTPERVHSGVGQEEQEEETVHDLLVRCQQELSRGHFAAAEELAQKAIGRDRKQVEADPLVCHFDLLQRVKAAAVPPAGSVSPCEAKPAGRHDVAPGEAKAIGSAERMVEALMREFDAAYREGRYRDAQALAQRAVQIDPDNAVAVGSLQLASIQMRLRAAAPVRDQPTAVRPVPAVVAKVNGTDAQPRRQAALAMARFCDHFKEGRYEEAKAEALKALSATPDDGSSLAALQMACAAMARQPRPAQAEQCTYVDGARPPLPVDPAVARALQKILSDHDKGAAEEAEPKSLPRR